MRLLGCYLLTTVGYWKVLSLNYIHYEKSGICIDGFMFILLP